LDTYEFLGLTLEEGLEIIKRRGITNYEVIETHGTKKIRNTNLTEPRVIRVTERDNNVSIIVGFF